MIFNDDGSFSFSVTASNTDSFKENVEVSDRVVVEYEGTVDVDHKYTLVDGEVVVEDYEQPPPPA
tara:strand:- start:1048 stop:1242 length:195 start_codon:yes stop_codon:yes gene_type:complete